MMLNEGHQRFEKAMAVIDQWSKDTPATNRISGALAEMNEFELTGASETLCESIEAWGVRYNRLMQNAQEAAGDESASLSEPEAVELASSLRATCELIRSVESERVLSRLRDHQGRLPEAEIELIRKYRDWFVPLLLQECAADIEKLEQAQDGDDASASDAVSSIALFTLYLASELELAESMPVLLRGLKLPGDLPFDLYGDAIPEQVPRYLAQFLSHEIDRIDAIVLDASLNTFVRWCSAGSYQYLVRDKVLTLEDAVQRLDRLFEATKVADEAGRPAYGHEYELSAGIVETIASIGGASLSTVVDSAHQWDFIDDFIISRSDLARADVQTDPSGLTDELRSLSATRIEDCLEELRDWASFREYEYTASPSAPIPRPASRPTPNPPPNQFTLQPPLKPVVRSERTPRNADCPCGSGKKYKKCCMRT